MGTSRYFSIAVLISAVHVVSACGSSGGGNDDVEQVVTVSKASRCAFEVPAGQPDNCMVEEIPGETFVTDQVVIHLSGTAPEAEDDGCPDPGLTLGGPVCAPPPFPVAYGVGWMNESNGASGSGDVRFLIAPLGPVRWRTYGTLDFSNSAIGKGIPLDFGPNRIRVTTSNSDLTGNGQVTITRVTDVTPPTVFRVLPEPGATSGSRNRITVYFEEQVDPASLVGAISVFDGMAQPVPGTTDYDPLRLQATWRPDTPLDSASTYSARIAGVTDWAPNVMLAPYDWSFTTRP